MASKEPMGLPSKAIAAHVTTPSPPGASAESESDSMDNTWAPKMIAKLSHYGL